MFLGHFGVALAAKELAPRTSLGALVLAAQFADLLWPIFLLTGLEQVRIAPGITRATPLDFVHYPITHSLVGQALWGVALGLLYFSQRRNAKSAVICWRLRGEPLVPRRYCAPARLACISSRAVCWPRIVEFPCQPLWPSSAVRWPLASCFICARLGQKIVSESTGCGPSWSC